MFSQGCDAGLELLRKREWHVPEAVTSYKLVRRLSLVQTTRHELHRTSERRVPLLLETVTKNGVKQL